MLNRNSVLSDPGLDSPQTSPVILARVAQHHRRQSLDAPVLPPSDQVRKMGTTPVCLSPFTPRTERVCLNWGWGGREGRKDINCIMGGFFKILFIYVYECFAWVYVFTTYILGGQKKASNPLELELYKHISKNKIKSNWKMPRVYKNLKKKNREKNF